MQEEDDHGNNVADLYKDDKEIRYFREKSHYVLHEMWIKRSLCEMVPPVTRGCNLLSILYGESLKRIL